MDNKNIALKLYNSQTIQNLGLNQIISLWIEIFSIEDLAKLWTECQQDLTLPYDDEVYNALNSQNYFE